MQYIAASLLALSVFVGCTSQARRSATQPMAVSPIDDACADALVASATVDTLHFHTQASSPTNNHTFSLVGRQQVSTSAPSVVAADNVTLLIDSGAVSRDVQISILAITEEHSGAIPDHLANLTADGAVYRMLPDGQRFEKDITIAMRYDSTALPYGYTADDIYTFFYNEQTHMWQQVERDSVDTQKQIVYSRTNHFTDYINGVLKVPESSDAMAYTPTSIKDLKAADPLEGITLMAPPEANNQGTANLTYPLSIPAGRRGMQPHLSVNYNSAGGSGILGLGWSLPVSEISVETRWGVPLYKHDKETEGYLLDGTTLVTSYLDENNNLRLNKPVYHRTYEPRNGNDTTRFYPRVEGAFRKIERIGTNPANYHWIVTDKDGTRHYYGSSNQATLRDHNRNIAKWMLEKSVDTYGNTISYSYATLCTPTGDGPAGKQICLTEIEYTGNVITQDAGRYKVRLHYADKRDRTFSFRYGLEETDNYIVDRIDVWYVDSLIREYTFGYRQGDFGKTLLCNIVEGYDDAARRQRYGTAPRPFNRIWSGLNPYDRCGVPPMSPDSIFVPLTHVFEYYEFDTSGSWFDTPVRFNSVDGTGNTSVLSSLSNALCNRFDIPVDSLNIGGSVSVGYNVGGAASVGFDGIKWLKTLSAGGHYSFSKDHSEGIVSIVDINGDGYPDKVYRTIDGLKCRPQLPGENAFGSPVQIRGAKGFQYSSSRTHNWGVEASAIGGLGAGANWSDSRSTTYTYFSDVNGDGLVDIVDDGRVFINRGNFHFSDVTDNDTVFVGGTCGGEAVSFSGEVEERIFDDGDYTVDSIVCIQLWDTVGGYWDTIYDFDPRYGVSEKNQDTIEPIFPNDVEVISLLDDTGTEISVKARRVRRYKLVPTYDSCYTVVLNKTYRYPRRYEPNIDLVRMWKAPYRGTISISGVASLTDSLNDFRARTRTTDGVWASVQRASDTILLDSATVTQGTPKTLAAVINVDTGEVIYFRLNAADRRLYDVVSWNPHIQYTHAVHRNGVAPDFDRHDANRNPIYTFDYGDDFMLTGNQTAGVGPDNGDTCKNNYSVSYDIRARGGLTQDMKLSLMCIDTLGYTENLQTTVFPRGTDSVFSASWNASDVPSDKSLYLQLEPKDGGQLNWSDIESFATITLLESTNDTLNARASRGLYSFTPVVRRKYYDYLAFPSSVISQQEGTPTIRLDVQSVPGPLSGKLFVTIKDTGENPYFEQELNLNAGTVSFTPTGFSFSSDRSYSLDVYVDNPAVANTINRVIVRLNGQEYDAGMYAKHANDDQKRHGTLYRGWGQFGYKSDDSTCGYVKQSLTTATALQDQYSGCTSQSELPIPQESDIDNFSAYNMQGNSTPEVTLGGVFRNPLAASFFEMQPNAEHACWAAFANSVTVSRSLASLDNTEPRNDTAVADTMPDMTQSPLPIVRPGTAFKAVNKMSLSASKGKTMLQESSSNGTSRMLGDYMDLNGDRYPDIVSEAQIQYSKAQGGLGGPVKGYALDRGINSSDFTSTGFAFNGTFASVVRELGNNPKNTRASNTVTGQSQLPPLSTGITKGEDRTGNTFMDINGDGLPDIVYADNRVRYNRGYGFTGFRTAPTLFVRKSQSISCSGGSGFNIGNTSISGGVSTNTSENATEAALMDVSGDGLPDWVFHGDIYINTGEGHARRHPSVGMDGSSTTSFSLNATYTDGVIIPLPFWAMKITGSVSGGATASFSTTHAEFVDMNNDGYVDYVYRGDSCIWVRYSKVGRSNLLKSVKNFAHAKYEIDYELSDATVQSPRRHWNMSKLKIDCGISKNGNNDIYKCFVYEKRIYDPYEREDYGYNVVITDYIHSDWFPTGKYYRRFCQTFHNDNYYMARLKISERTSDSSGSSFVGTLYQYRDADLTSGRYLGDDTPLWCQGDGWPAVASEETHYNEGTGDIITTKREYTYGQYGNVVSVHDFGDVLSSNDDYSVTIDYNLDHNQHIVSNASNLTIPGYRQRSATYNAKGSLSTLTIDNGGSLSIFRYSYDTYGNLDTVFTPATNSAGDPYWITYSYDSETRSLPIRVENAEGHIGTTSYSHRWQKPTRTTDIGGNTMRYMYDAHGRTNLIKAPKEVVANRPYTIKYDYWYNSRHKLSDYENTNFPTQLDSGIVFCFWARTRNFDPEHPQNDINTVTFSDGLGRIIQVKKDIEENGIERRSVSGAIYYDYFGRESVHFQTTSEPIDYPDTNINTRTDLSCRTIMNYDYLDRGIRTTYPDGTYDSNAYSIEKDDDGIYRFLTAATDQNGNTSLLYTDHRQLNIQLTNALRHTTRFRYDAIGQLMASTDPEGNITEHHYDLGGRRIRRVHPSAGTTQWQYDPAGNMILQTQNSGEQIAYTYDYSRPVHVNYSHRPWNNVWYEYGAAGSGNESGRLVRQQDASGVQEFSYDNMGNVTSNRHTYIQPHTNNTFSLSTSWTYDSWGRVKSITYPDKELVSYHYDQGGNLRRVRGEKGRYETDYIKEIRYDRFGQRTLVRYENNVETRYIYDSLTRRLARMYDTSHLYGLLQDNRYTYDSVGNITSIVDNGLNRRWQTYEYDPANRLIQSEGNMDGLGLEYRSDYKYSAAGKITRKNVQSTRFNNHGLFSMDYTNKYHYPTAGNPFAIEKVSDMNTGGTTHFHWDSNGNLVHAGNNRNSERRLRWTEDNRLQAFWEHSEAGDIAAWYNYTADGTRNFKFTSPKLLMSQNASYIRLAPPLVDPTLYASPLLTLSKHGYTKHYFEEGRRICSKIGGGFDAGLGQDIERPVGVISGSLYILHEQQRMSVQKTFTHDMNMEAGMEGVHDLSKVVMNHELGRDDPEPAFFYHSDHLGSAAYITDEYGQWTQMLNYLPYGEDWVERNRFNPADTTRLAIYRFNGKEKDHETGFHYYGARYYWSELLTGWLSVDPMMDKYPGISPYNYCMWNPVMLVDPDGEDCRFAVNHKKKTITISANIILYSRRIDTHQLNKIASQYQKDIMGAWSKDENGKNWTYKGYNVVFDVKVSVNQSAVNPQKRNYQSGENNYIEVVDAGTIRSHVNRTMNTGVWEAPIKNHDAAPHEFAHLLGLKDRYAEYTQQNKSGRSIICSEPFSGWDGNIMAERNNGKVEQRNIDAIFKGLNVDKLDNLIKRKNDFER